MKKLLSDKITGIKPSGIRRFFDVANTMEDVISLGVGEPDFDTPWFIRDEGIYSLEKGRTFYTSNAGLPELKKEIAGYIQRRYKVTYDPKDEIIVTVGGSEGIDIAIRAMTNPGDEIIVPQPSYVSYEPCVVMAGGTPVIIELEEKDGFKLTPEKIEEKITDSTKLLVLPFPNNPTGSVMTYEELAGIAKICIEKDIWVLSDEIYSELTYTKEGHASITQIPGMKERTILINGFSKAYAMTGWRLGYACAPEAVMKQMLKIHQYCIMCAPTTSQYAAIAALRNGDGEVAVMRESYNQRRRLLLKRLGDMGIPVFEPEGAFYIFPNISKFGMSSEEFALKLLEEKHVAVVPGSAFGDCGEGYIRISYAYSIKQLEQAMRRIKEFIQEK